MIVLRHSAAVESCEYRITFLGVSVDFAESSEHVDLRAAVAAIARPFGGAYYADHARDHEPCDEAWDALGAAGFIRVNVPAGFGGGGAGLVELEIVCEEAAAQGVPLLLMVVSSAISAEVIS